MKKLLEGLVYYLKRAGLFLLSSKAWLISIFIIIILFFSSYFGYSAYKKFKDRFDSIQLKLNKYESGKLIAPGTVISSSRTVSRKDFDSKLKELASKDKEIKKLVKELKNKKVEIVTVTNTRVKIVKEVVYKDKPSDQVEDKVHIKKVLDSNKLHLATVRFNTKNLKAPWTLKIHPLRLKLHIFHSIKKNSPDLVSLDIKIIDHAGLVAAGQVLFSKTSYTYPKTKVPSWSLSITPFNLELYGLLGLDISDKNFSGGFNLASHLLKLKYGSEDVFRFVGLGIGYNSPSILSILFYPVSYNLGTSIPFISDLFVTINLGLGIDFNNTNPQAKMLMMLGIGTTL